MKATLRKYGILILLILATTFSSNILFAQNTLDLAGLTSATPSAVAFSTRKLSSTYAGFVMQIRRGVDNAVANLSFDANNTISLNSNVTYVSGGSGTTTLSSFLISGTSAYIAIWYDQSGNGRNATQANTTLQPLIVNAGTIVSSSALNNKTTISFNGTNSYLDLPMASTVINATGTIAAVETQPALQNNFNSIVAWTLSGGTQGPGFGPLNTGTGAFGLYTTWGPSNISLGPVAANQGYMMSAAWTSNGSSVTQSLNGTTSTGTLGASFNYTGNAYVGRDAGSYYNGNLSELIVSNTAINDVNRTAMETNQNGYYNLMSFAGALYLDGINDYVKIPDNNSLDFGSGDFTIETWTNKIKASAGWKNNGIVLKWNTGAKAGTNEWGLNNTSNGSDNKAQFLIESGSTIYTLTSTNPMTLGTWYHLAVTRKGNTLTLYINGVADVSTTIPAGTVVNNVGRDVTIGAFEFPATVPDIFSNILIDELRIWGRALCNTEIQNNLNGELNGAQNGLIAYYKFNQGYINANNNAVTSLIDGSGNNNNGQLINFGLTGATSNWIAGKLSGTSPVYVASGSPITGNTSVCVGATSALSNTISGGSWTSSNTAIATVSASGLVTGVASGAVTITYTNPCAGVSTTTVTINALPALTGITTSTSAVDYLVVAGGGGGAAGGGGGGGVLTGTNYAVSPGQSFTVTVGVGGTAGVGGSITTSPRSTSGGNSIFATLTAIGGGGGGGNSSTPPLVGGSGGGGGYDQPNITVAAGTIGQGNAGGKSNVAGYGASGGGGGAATAGSNAPALHFGGKGGDGKQSSISGVATYYGGGGGGGINDNIQPTITPNGGGAGGLGGGGNGSSMGWSSGANFNGTSGTPATGGGGGGTDPESTVAGSGGSGIVIIRYLGTPSATGGTITQAGGYTIHTFATPGTFSFVTNPNISSVCAGASVVYTNPTSGGVWSSSNSAIATVDASGKVTGVSAGTAVISYTITNASNCSSTVTQSITVNATPTATITTPAISTTCPGGSISLQSNIGTGYAYQWKKDGINISGATAASYAAAATGSYTVVITGTAGCVSAVSNTIAIAVQDILAPTFNSATADINAVATSANGAVVNYTLPTVTDNCTANPNVTAVPASGSVFPIGTTLVTVTATDAKGNSANTTFNIIVSGLAPSIVKPADISIASPLGECGANVNFAATETTGIPVPTITYTEDGSEVVSGANFSVGVHTITATATNAIGSTSVDFTITVIDDQLPTITAPADIIIDNTEGHCGAINVRLGWPEVADNCSVVDFYPTYHSEFPVGTTDVEWTVVDASGNIATAIQRVTVIDNEKPFIRKAFDWGREGGTAEPGKCGTSNIASLHLGVPGTQSTFIVSDNCGPTVITSNAPTFFPVGVTIVTYTVTDIHGNFSTIDEEVTVSDFEPPVIASVADINVNATSAAGAVVNYTAPIGTDNCTAATTVMTAGLASGSTFSIGTTVVTYTVTDATGLTASTSFNVTVTGLAPAIVAPDNYLVNSEAGKCGASVNFAATETKAIPASTIAYTENGTAVVSGAYFTVGTHTITATATNAVGSSSVDFTITVVDHELPTVITQSKTIYLDASGHASISVADINDGSTDNCAIDHIALDKTAFDCSNLGANTVNLTVNDIHGNVNSATAIVTVQDLIAPVLSAAPADAIVECNAVPAAAVLTATDNCSATVTFAETRINGKSKNDYTLTRTWTATDAAGNSVSKTQTIIVQDTKAPILAVPTNISVNTDNNVCGATINFAATATDNCAVPVISYSQNPNTVFPVGITTVIVTATDASGNTSTGSFTITVKDKQVPIAKAKNITLGLGTAVGGLVNLTAAQIDNGSTDACGIASMTVVPASFGCSKIGANTVTLTVTDVNGNVSTTTAIVTVVDDKGPVPTVTSLPVISGQCYATALTLKPGEDGGMDDGQLELDHYYLVVPTAMDNCSGLIKGTTTDALTYYNQGDHVIHWKFVDAKGNVTIQEQHVIIQDTYAPVPKRASLPTLTGQCSVNVASGSNSDDDGEDNDGGDDDHGKAPWAFDNCSGWIMGTTTSALTYNIQGTYTIDWTFDDGHGNTSHQYQTVIVKDVTAPRIKAPNDKTVACGSNILPAVTGMATATDNCSTPVISFTDVNNGTLITRTWTATDAAGNTSSDVQTIKLTPAFTATVSSTPTSTVYTGGSAKNIYLGYGAQSTILSVSGLPAGNYTYIWSGASLVGNTTATPVFNATAVGVFTFYVTVSNASGCSSTASISICVTDVRVAGSNGALIYVCHQGTNKTGGTQTLSVPVAQVAAHLANTCGGKGGDKLGSCNSTACTTNTVTTSVDPKTTDPIELTTLKADVTSAAPLDDIKVTVMPNPSTTYFTLKFESKDMKTPMSLRVMDASGRAIEAKQQIDPSSTIQIGHNYPSGTFYTEVIQGNKRKVVQMIKARG